MTKDKLSGLAFHMKQSEGKVFLVGDLRGVGKTEALIELANKEVGVYVASSEGEAKVNSAKFDSDEWMSIRSLLNTRGLRKKFYVDEGCIGWLIEKGSQHGLENAQKVLEFVRHTEKVVLNTNDIKAIFGLKKSLIEELRDSFSHSNRIQKGFQEKVGHILNLIKEFEDTFTFLA